jgi:hypothetical protein
LAEKLESADAAKADLGTTVDLSAGMSGSFTYKSCSLFRQGKLRVLTLAVNNSAAIVMGNPADQLFVVLPAGDRPPAAVEAAGAGTPVGNAQAVAKSLLFYVAPSGNVAAKTWLTSADSVGTLRVTLVWSVA